MTLFRQLSHQLPHHNKMNKRRRLLSLFTMFAFFSLTNFAEVLAATFRCESPSGAIIHTDSPAQLEKCQVLSTESSMNTQSSRNPTDNPQPLLGSQEQKTLKDSDTTHEYSFRDEKQSSTEEVQTDTAIIPVIPYGGSLLVTVRLNQIRNAQLILDTGATMTVLSTDVALDLGLIASTNTQLTTVNTAGGQIQVNLSTLSSIQAGTAKVDDVEVAIHDLPDTPSGIDGLLGMSFLHHFLVTLDTNKRQLHLKSRAF